MKPAHRRTQRRREIFENYTLTGEHMSEEQSEQGKRWEAEVRLLADMMKGQIGEEAERAATAVLLMESLDNSGLHCALHHLDMGLTRRGFKPLNMVNVKAVEESVTLLSELDKLAPREKFGDRTLLERLTALQADYLNAVAAFDTMKARYKSQYTEASGYRTRLEEVREYLRAAQDRNVAEHRHDPSLVVTLRLVELALE